jgi:membrane protein implicated in regulation of membrane protease activity
MATGLACLIMGLLANFGYVSLSVPVLIGLTAALSCALTAALWRPMKALQNRGGQHQGPNVHSDLVGQTLKLDMPLTPTSPGTARFGGVDFEVVLDPGANVSEVPAGQTVEVVAVEVGRFVVTPEKGDTTHA